MRIWLATVGEPLPTDGTKVRLLRTAQFAQWLADHGHDVTFWTGTMDHYGRKLRHNETHVTQLQPNYRIVELAGRKYNRSISYNRFMNHVDVAREFERTAPNFDAPDIVMSSFPTLELCEAIARFSEDRKIPFVVDVRDFWPDIFSETLPKPVRWLAPLAFAGFDRRTGRVLTKATALSGMTQSALDWALTKANRKQSSKDFWHSFTYPVADEPMASIDQMPDQSQIDLRPDVVKFCFFGTHSHRVNLEMFVRSFLTLERQGVPVSLMLCGKGAVTDSLRKMAAGSRSVLFPGWLNSEQIRFVMSISQIGVLPYNTPDFHMNIPNKVAEYMSSGLPLFSCTDGEVRRLIETTGCGFWGDPQESAIVKSVHSIVSNREKIASASEAATGVFKQTFEANAVFSRVVDKFAAIVEPV